jgi:hypothetical protein
VLLNPKTGKFKSIFKSDKWNFHEAIFDRPVLGSRVYFLLTHKHFHNVQKILEVKGNKTRVIPIDDYSNLIHYCRVAGASDDPLQFILFRKPNPLPPAKEKTVEVRLVKETGKARVLFEAKALATWKNRLLRFAGKKMELYEFNDELIRIPLEVTNLKKVPTGQPLKGNFIQKRVLVHDGGKYFLFDMETLEMEKVKINALPYFYYEIAGGIRMVWVKGDEISVSTWEKGRLVVENIWYTKIDPIKRFRRVEVTPAGIVVLNQKQQEIFFFAERKEVGRSGGQ